MSNRLSAGPDPRSGSMPVRRGFSANSLLKNSTASLLKAADVKGNETVIQVYGIRPNTAKGIFADVLLDIEPVNGKGVFPLNTTNIQRLAELIGDDLSEVVGKLVTVGKFDYGGEFGEGLQVLSVDEPKTEGKKK